MEPITKQPKLGRPQMYPWDLWLSVDEALLIRGKDFDCEPFSLALQARRAAKNRGLEISVQVCRDIVVITPKS